MTVTPPRSFEDYPARMVTVSVLFTLALYAAGALVLSGFGPAALVPYLIFLLWSELRVMRSGCVNCFYYGRWCAFGRGKVAALLFRRGDPARFLARPITWIDLLPDLLVPLLPVVGGIGLLLQEFVWWRAVLLGLLVAGATYGNYVVRSTIACRYCRQRELGCPAERLFSQDSEPQGGGAPS